MTLIINVCGWDAYKCIKYIVSIEYNLVYLLSGNPGYNYTTLYDSISDGDRRKYAAYVGETSSNR